MKNPAIVLLFVPLLSLACSGCQRQSETHQTSGGQGHEHAEGDSHQHKIVVTNPVRKDVIKTQPYVSQVHSCQHIEVRALEGGYLEKICVKEGQAVKKGELMFQILPVLHEARLDSEKAEASRIQTELTNAEVLLKKDYLSDQAIILKKAELAKAKAKVALAEAELGFTRVTAPFDGIVDRQRNQLGSLIEEGDVLTTFSDNSKMWVYFNVPESQYLEYVAEMQQDGGKGQQVVRDDDDEDDDDEDDREGNTRKVSKRDDDDDDDDDGEEDDDADDKVEMSKVDPAVGSGNLKIELRLANGKIFPQPGAIGAIEADFNNTTGNISFRADFVNPQGVLRNGQTGTILIHSTMKNVIVIPQRATFEILAKRYAYVVDQENIVHQRDITIHSAQDDIFVIESGLAEGDKIVFEGIRQVRDGDKIEYEFLAPEKVLGSLKYHAE